MILNVIAATRQGKKVFTLAIPKETIVSQIVIGVVIINAINVIKFISILRVRSDLSGLEVSEGPFMDPRKSGTLV
jgi:hypothetical protein